MTNKWSVMPVALVPLTILLVLPVLIGVGATTVDSKIREDSDLSQFYQLLEANPVANSTLMYRSVTVFAPTNRAFQKLSSNEDRGDLVLYHMSNLPKTTDELGDSILSELDGNPPLWVTRKRVHSRDEIYINNAKILEGSIFKSKIKTPNGDVRTQVLHKIDEVLQPVVSIATADPRIDNPNAFKFLNQSDSLSLGKLRVRTYRLRVTRTNKEHVFNTEGRYTFFIPVDDGFKPNPRPEKVDAQVIDGHVIPGHVLFTTPTPKNVPYNTLAFSDNLKVTISFVTRQDKIYVESNTLFGPANYTTGVVPAEILKANIPVQNGVVHLIQRPLMVVDTTVQQFLESFKDKEDGPVYEFYQVIRDLGDNFMATLTNSNGLTLFAPSNAAWEAEGVKNILQDKKRLREILNLHYVRERLPLDKIKEKSVNQVETAAQWKSLYFNVITGYNGSQTVTVEGGGVNATVITANIAATNGIIHIIDRVLGVPYTTVFDKLRTDPMMNSTYYLGTQRRFNEQLNDTKRRFTYFVPRNSAWENVKINIPSTYKKIFMPQFNYHTKQILERHLVIANQPYTMAQLKKLSINGTIELQTVRDTLKLRVRDNDNSYQVEWMGKWIRVYRPDVPCTNGIIHVIDNALVSAEDVQVVLDSAGTTVSCVTTHLLMILIAKWFL